ncbi:MAG: subtype B tannase [Moraxella sp.]|nr:subtype B tannase [Moraxella sp.]
MKNSFVLKTLLISLSIALTACQTPNQATPTTITAPANLTFDPTNHKPITITQDGQSLVVRAFENIPYVANPTEPDYQVMNIYIPERYFTGDSINGYTADTAPIFFPNGVGGYMPAKPMTAESRAGRDGTSRPNSVAAALLRGYVVASAGARGRTLGMDGNYTGKAPSVIVDLKSAIRYLKANDALMAGRADRIISSGTSAGGAVSALLGASGGSMDYHAELQKVGAIMVVNGQKIDDSIFAVSAYAPITNLENADMAYEWQFNGIFDYQKMHVSMLDYNVKRERIQAILTDEQKIWSNELKSNFPNYINSLKLTGQNGQTLTLDNNGNGTFKDEVIYHLNKSANTAFKNGMGLTEFDFLAQRKSVNPFYVADFDGYLKYLGRGKGVPAFDATDLTSGENNLFGNRVVSNQHFTAFGKKYGQGSMADAHTVKMMNAMNYITQSPTQHWRIRHGAKDNDTSLAVPVILATALQNQGKNVDFALPWGVGHGGDYDLSELFDWADKLVKSEQ